MRVKTSYLIVQPMKDPAGVVTPQGSVEHCEVEYHSNGGGLGLGCVPGFPGTNGFTLEFLPRGIETTSFTSSTAEEEEGEEKRKAIGNSFQTPFALQACCAVVVNAGSDGSSRLGQALAGIRSTGAIERINEKAARGLLENYRIGGIPDSDELLEKLKAAASDAIDVGGDSTFIFLAEPESIERLRGLLRSPDQWGKGWEWDGTVYKSSLGTTKIQLVGCATLKEAIAVMAGGDRSAEEVRDEIQKAACGKEKSLIELGKARELAKDAERTILRTKGVFLGLALGTFMIYTERVLIPLRSNLHFQQMLVLTALSTVLAVAAPVAVLLALRVSERPAHEPIGSILLRALPGTLVTMYIAGLLLWAVMKLGYFPMEPYSGNPGTIANDLRDIHKDLALALPPFFVMLVVLPLVAMKRALVELASSGDLDQARERLTPSSKVPLLEQIRHPALTPGITFVLVAVVLFPIAMGYLNVCKRPGSEHGLVLHCELSLVLWLSLGGATVFFWIPSLRARLLKRISHAAGSGQLGKE